MTSVHQRFSIKFVKTRDLADGQSASDIAVQGTSGNPGYIDGLPLLIGKKEATGNAEGAVQIYEEGFRVRGGDAAGTCLEEIDAELSEMGDPTLRFNVNLSYGCTVSYNFNDLQKMCQGESGFPLITNFEIFKNLEDIDSYGFFGNANIHYPKVSQIPFSNAFIVL